MQQTSNVVLDRTGVTSMDSAGIGELALLQTWAQEKNASLKCAGANSLVRTLLDLTNLDSVIEVHPSLDAALESFREQRGCAGCRGRSRPHRKGQAPPCSLCFPIDRS